MSDERVKLFPNDMDDETLKKFQEEMAEKFRGVRNAGRLCEYRGDMSADFIFQIKPVCLEWVHKQMEEANGQGHPCNMSDIINCAILYLASSMATEKVSSRSFKVPTRWKQDNCHSPVGGESLDSYLKRWMGNRRDSDE